MRSFHLIVVLLVGAMPLSCSSSDGTELAPPGEDEAAGSTGGNFSAPGSGGAGTGGAAGPTGGISSGDTGGAGTTFLESIIIEEGQSGFCSVDGVVESTNKGFTGTGYANTDNTAGTMVEWALSIGEAGTYYIDFAYANGSGDRTGQVLVDGESVSNELTFSTTSDWTTWATVGVGIPLTAGEHQIALASTGAEGLANIDSLTVSGAAVNSLDCNDGGGSGGSGTGGEASGGSGSGGDGTGGAPSGPITIWIAGDSTVANGNTPCPAGWGKHFKQYFNDEVTVSNAAVGGRSIQTWLYEGNVSSTKGGDGECVLTSSAYSSRWTSMLEGMKSGDYLFIQFGINDGDSSCPRHVGGALYMEYLSYMADAAKERGVSPIFLTPTAAIQCSGSTAVGNRGFLNETKNAASANSVTLIDINALSVQLYNTAGLCPNSGIYTGNDAVGQFFCDDHTHFADTGAIQIAGAVAQAVADQALPLASYLAQ